MELGSRSAMTGGFKLSSHAWPRWDRRPSGPRANSHCGERGTASGPVSGWCISRAQHADGALRGIAVCGRRHEGRPLMRLSLVGELQESCSRQAGLARGSARAGRSQRTPWRASGLHAALRLTRFPRKASGHQEGYALVPEGAMYGLSRVPRLSYSRGGWQWQQSGSPPRRPLNA
jgi:hypothetical protein